MKIFLIRGPSLNEWEMQNFEPLQKQYKLVAVGSVKPIYPLNSLRIPVVKLHCLGQLLTYIPKNVLLLNKILGNTSYLFGLEKAISGCDIVHTAECANYYSYQAVKAKQRGLVKKVVVTCWENIPFNRQDYPAQKKLKDVVRKEADFFIAVTKQVRTVLVKEGVSEKKIEVVPMGVNISKFQSRSCTGTNFKSQKKSKLKILFIGRLEKEKGVWELLEAFKYLKNETSLSLRLAGSGSQKAKISAWITKECLSDSISILSNLSYLKIPQLYQQADIFVLPSKPTPTWQEQFGIVLVEAMASGLPIVASKSGSIPEIVGNAGLLVPPGNWQKLAFGLKKLFIDKKLRQELSGRGRKRVEKNFDCRLTAQKISNLYQKVLGNSLWK